MLFTYGITRRGAYHIKNDTVCQDAHNIIKCNDTMAIAAVADGLGSELYSDIAAQTAVEVSAKYCAENIVPDLPEDKIISVIQTSFELSQKRIEEIAQYSNHELDQYDTTLSVAVLIDNTLYYGHVGDSGIIALTGDGLYCKVTEQQRDSEGKVFPLYFGKEKWIFGRYNDSVASVLLATDGMLDTFFPIYLRAEPINIYVALARYFMDHQYHYIEEIGEEGFRKKIDSFVDSIQDVQVDDDKTVVVIMNTSVEVSVQPDDYYAEPDWHELKRKYDESWRRVAYPHLYGDEK